jgi:hypothetical protein
VSYTAWRNTPLEQAAFDFLLDRSGLPLGSRLWTFGTAVHADDDGWTIEAGTMLALEGRLEFVADAAGEATLTSPAEVALPSAAVDRVVVGVDDDADVRAINVAARSANGAWQPLADARAGDIARTLAGCAVTVATRMHFDVDRIRVTIRVAPRSRFSVTRVAIVRAR